MSDPNQQFQAPPPPPPFAPTAPPAPVEMSLMGTLTGIFFEPGRVFESLRTRPRFLVAGIILLVLTIVVTVVLFTRVDMGAFLRERMDRSSNSGQQTEQQKDTIVKIMKAGFAVGIPAAVPFLVAAGAALYLLGVMAFGGTISYSRALAVWVYSSLPPAVLTTLVAVLVLFLKAADTVDPKHIMITNPGAFMGKDSSKVITALLSQFDVLKFYGLFLAAIGLRKVAKISSGSAWAIVLGFWLIAAIFEIAGAAIGGG